MKEVYVDYNPLKSGMEFNSFADIGRFLNVQDLKHGNAIKGVMKHYCTWYKDDILNKIIIDEVFEKVKPFRVPGYRYEVGEIITVNTGSYIIIDRYIGDDTIHKNNGKTNIYKCRCLIDNYEFELPEFRIKFGIGCPICGNRKIIEGVRSLYDTHPQMLKYLKDPEDAKNFTPYSGKKILCKCPECGHEKYVNVSNLVKSGFSCPICSDHISYPNKFVREFLNQLDVKYEPEKCFDWSDDRKYDQYVEEHNMIIENHGLQHYKDCKGKFSDLKTQIKNDKYKYDLAMNNGINRYIVIDCRESSLEWIKKSIMDSELVDIFNFNENDIDWEQCHIVASTNSEIKKVCEAYKTNHNIKSLAEMFDHDPHTITSYLETGVKCGYCDFRKNDPTKNGLSLSWQASAKPVYCITDNIYFMSKNDCVSYYKQNGIANFNGKILYHYIISDKEYKGKRFKYISKREYNEMYDESFNNDDIKIIGEKYLERYMKGD